ncbi:MAG TPA: HAD-IIIA family hydrolase [Victivallales bacterium]|nr:HAD-IIIA family hydrolase [Victivallales bacterium]
MKFREKILRIKTIIFDIDGVLTDGLLGYGEKDEIKFFHVRDGHGIKMARRMGLKVGILSGRAAEANRRRTKELELDFFYEGRKDKKKAFEELLIEQSLNSSECAYLGDDVIDIPILKACGFSAVTADAPRYMDEFCDFRTGADGGRGAARELIDLVLMEKGLWEKAIAKYKE